MTALSVVIACLDVADVLGRQLDALAQEQADFDWEVVVVDNGSSDGTEAVAMSYEKRLPALRIVHEPERGRHYAANAGAAVANAPKLAFIDADDVIEPGYVTAIARALDEHDVVAGRLVNVTADGAPLSGFGQMQVDGLEPSFGFLPFAAGPNLGILKDVFAAVGGFSADVPFGEDVDLSWRLTLAGHAIGFEPEAVVRYHQRAGLGAMFRQHRRFGAAHAYLYAKYRGAGMPRRGLRVVAQDWWRCVVAVPFLRDDQVRARFVRRLARNIGRVEGSVRARAFYL